MKKILSVIILLVFCLTYILPANAKAKDDYISIDRDSKHLGSRLHKEYVGYVYTIENISDKSIIIDGISFQDNITGNAAYGTVSRSSIAEGLKTLGVGLAFALPTLTLSLIGSVIITPVVMIGNTCGNIGAKQDSERYDKTVDSAYLKPSSKIELKTLAARFNKPTITIMYHIEQENNLLKLSY